MAGILSVRAASLRGMTSSSVDLVLLPGLWLPASVWDPVVERLAEAGLTAVAPALPGVDPAGPATLDDQLDAVLRVVDAAGSPVVVGHSAASGLAWLVADRRPQRVRRVVLVGGFPSADGDTYADFFPVVDGVMPFPGWAPFEGPDAADLDDTARAALAATTVAVPAGVSQAVVHLRDERRHAVPVTLVCPEFSAEEARGWVHDGDLPELARVADLTVVDVDSGHWPMVTRPAELAALLVAAARAPRG